MPGTRKWPISLGCQPRARGNSTWVQSSSGPPWSWLLRLEEETQISRRRTSKSPSCFTLTTPSSSLFETMLLEPCCWWELWTMQREKPSMMNCSARWCIFFLFLSSLSLSLPHSLSKTTYWFLSRDIVIHCGTLSRQTTAGCHCIVSRWQTLTLPDPTLTQSLTHTYWH